MNRSAPERVHRTFHRLGILGAGVVALFAIPQVLLAFQDPANTAHINVAGAIILWAAATYGIFRAIGWVIAAMLGD